MVRTTGEDPRQVPVAEVKPDTWAHQQALSIKDDTVTLTKTQFQQILEAIGQTNGVNGPDRLYNRNDSDLSPAKTFYKNGHDTISSNDEQADGNMRSDHQPIQCPLDIVVSCPASTVSWCEHEGELSPTKLSRLEQKRLQWEKEKAEMLDWNPWGKPGAGAPARKTQVVNPILPNNNNQLLMVHSSNAMPLSSSLPSAFPSCAPSPSHRIMSSNMDPFLPPRSSYNSVPHPIKPVPAVFKSSIAFGNPDCDISNEFYRRQDCLREFDSQREERKRHLQDQMQMSDSVWPKKDVDMISAEESLALAQSDIPNWNVHMRGSGLHLDPASIAQAEERRQKAHAYRQDIFAQMEEKQRKQAEERELRRQEEEALELRLQAERLRIQQEYEEEQRRIRQKAELEEKKHEALVVAVREAQEQAELEKKSRKFQKLLPHANLEKSPVRTPLTSHDRVEALANGVESILRIDDNISVDTMKVSQKSPQLSISESVGTSDYESIEKKDVGVQIYPVIESDTSATSHCIVDRILTPSIYRVRARCKGVGKEFGTQTDMHYGKYTVEDAESTESNTSSFHSPKRVVRVQHSKPYKVQRRIQNVVNALPSERPKWGVNQPAKSYVRMTERDPHFPKRKRMQELRKQHWARELERSQKMNENVGRSTLASSSYPCLRACRMASSSDCTVGYSSSELETRSHRPCRSNSMPRYHPASGFRSDCGSSEIVTYYNCGSSAHTSRFGHPLSLRRDSHSSGNLPSIIGGSEPSPPRHNTHRLPMMSSNSLPPMRRKWHSQETFYPSTFSPPHVPGVHPKTLCDALPPVVLQPRRKWSDQESFDLESVVRSRGIENNSRISSADASEKSLPLSISSTESSDLKSPIPQNPLVCPEVVTDRPSSRHHRILQNLSSVRQGLLKKQIELAKLIRRPPSFHS